MAYEYNIPAALELMQQVVMSDFTAQGETPTGIPFSFTAQQYSAEGMAYPATVIECNSADPSTGTNTVQITANFTIHHYRQRTAGANAELTALSRLAHLAATISTDHTLSSFNPTIPVEVVKAGKVTTNQETGMLSAQQNVSIAHASMSVSIQWTEFKYD